MSVPAVVAVMAVWAIIGVVAAMIIVWTIVAVIRAVTREKTMPRTMAM
jgi:hypothetical protein